MGKEGLKVASGKVKATGYAAGTSHITVADLAMLASYRTIRSIYGEKLMDCCPDQNNCQELNEWFERVKKEVKNYVRGGGREGGSRVRSRLHRDDEEEREMKKMDENDKDNNIYNVLAIVCMLQDVLNFNQLFQKHLEFIIPLDNIST